MHSNRRRAADLDAVVTDGLCSHLAEGGCVEAVIKDASLLLFDTAQHAADFVGCGDDQADSAETSCAPDRAIDT